MAFDPAIALQGSAGPVLPNPLEFFSKMQGIQQSQHQNLLFQQQNDARVAQGEAYKRAIGPDGRLDEAKLLELLGGMPGGQFALPEAIAAGQARKKEAQGIQEKELALGRQRIALFSETLGGLMGKGDKVTDADVHRVVSKLAVQLGDPALAKTMFVGMQDMPKGGKELQDWIKQQNIVLLSAAEKIGFQAGEMRPTDVGGRINILQQNRLDGSVQSLGSLNKTPTVEQSNALVSDAKDDSGAPIALPRSEAAPMRDGAGNIVSTPSPGAPARLGPGIEATADLTASSTQLNRSLDEIAAQMGASQKNLQEIGKMRELLEQIGTGPLAPTQMKIAQLAQQLGFDEKVVRGITGGADPAAVAAAEAFMKKTWSQSMAALKSMTPGGTQWTGQEVFANLESNPNIKMTPQAIRDLFDFETFKYNFLKEAQDYKTNWRRYNPDKPLRQMEVDWAKHAEAKGWVKPVTSGRGENATGFFNAPLIRDETIPQWVSIIDLSQIPRGSVATIAEFPDGTGTRVKIRRGNGAEGGNTYSVVR